jgi:hypothetical protein
VIRCCVGLIGFVDYKGESVTETVEACANLLFNRDGKDLDATAALTLSISPIPSINATMWEKSLVVRGDLAQLPCARYALGSVAIEACASIKQLRCQNSMIHFCLAATVTLHTALIEFKWGYEIGCYNASTQGVGGKIAGQA